MNSRELRGQLRKQRQSRRQGISLWLRARIFLFFPWIQVLFPPGIYQRYGNIRMSASVHPHRQPGPGNRNGGEGGDPPTPLSLFFKERITPPHSLFFRRGSPPQQFTLSFSSPSLSYPRSRTVRSPSSLRTNPRTSSRCPCPRPGYGSLLHDRRTAPV
jgi:hypothetical protein